MVTANILTFLEYIWKCKLRKKTRVSPDIFNYPAGNRTPVSSVTGGDTHHYTTEDY